KEPTAYTVGSHLIPAAGFEPARPHRTLDFESSASACSATPAKLVFSVKIDKAVTGFEPVVKVLQTSALPLGYTAILRIYSQLKTGLLGFEPRNDGTKTRCLTAWL